MKVIINIYSHYSMVSLNPCGWNHVIDYFNKYSLLSFKYLDFKDWSKLINYINK